MCFADGVLILSPTHFVYNSFSLPLYVEFVNTIILVISLCVMFWLANPCLQDSVCWKLVAQKAEGRYCANPRNTT